MLLYFPYIQCIIKKHDLYDGNAEFVHG
jgi:hypothetical protein